MSEPHPTATIRIPGLLALDDDDRKAAARCPWLDPVTLEQRRVPLPAEIVALAGHRDLTLLEARQAYTMAYVYADAWVVLRKNPAFLRVLRRSPHFRAQVEGIRDMLNQNVENPAYVWEKP